jgi:transcription-repair coupling factor (superfamily II helicase)
VADIAAEWADRYGPPPPQAEALLAVGRLRAECVRTGVTEVTAAAAKLGATGPGRPGEIVVRVSPVRLAVSSQVRLKRLHPRAILKEDSAQLIVPLAAGDDLADRLVVLLGGLLPPEVTGPGGGSPPTITGS